MDGFRHIIDTARSKFGVLSFNQKVLLGAVVTASVISVAVFSLWLQKEDMAVLFTGLSPEDASAALAELSKQDVKTELENGGTTILVPAGEKDRLRLDLTTKGDPVQRDRGLRDLRRQAVRPDGVHSERQLQAGPRRRTGQIH